MFPGIFHLYTDYLCLNVELRPLIRDDVIASGSLLGLSYGKDADKEVVEVESVPVGYEKQVITNSSCITMTRGFCLPCLALRLSRAY